MKKSFDINPEHVFKCEIDCIENEMYQHMAVEALYLAPDYFYFAPASSSGKYHPKSSLGLSGLVRHVKSVCRIAEELLSHPLYAPFTNEEKDAIRVACLLHDCLKQGTGNSGTHTVTDHPLLIREGIKPTICIGGYGEVGEKAWSLICDLIETHMGIWTKDRETGQEVLKVPETKMQLFVHLCDFLASRKIIEVDVTDREPQANYNSDKVDKDKWRNDTATDSQVEYIKKLYVIAGEKGTNLPPITLTDNMGNRVLTKGLANDIIDRTKKVLGLK